MALSWCKVASNLDSHPKIRKAGRNGREVFLFALRRNAEPGNPVPGRLPLDELEPWYLADQLQMPECDAVTGVTAAVTAGLLVLDGMSYVIVGWEGGWGKDNATGAVRTARYRENKRLEKTVTDCDARDVTQSHSDTCDIEEKRLEEKRLEGITAKSPALGALGKKAKALSRASRKSAIPDDWKPERTSANLNAEDEARTRGIDLDLQLKNLHDWALANNAKKADWDATWRNWTRNAKPSGSQQGQTSFGTPRRSVEL